MTNLVETLYSWLSFVRHISIRNLLEIVIIAFLVYEILLWIKNTRAWTLLKGIVVILGFTVLGSYAVIAGLLWVGFLGGVLAAVVVLQLGLGGLVLLGAASVPQVLVYVPAGFFFQTVVYRMSERSRLEGAAGRGKYREYLLACTAGMALIFCGVLAECYVNPYILHAVLGG